MQVVSARLVGDSSVAFIGTASQAFNASSLPGGRWGSVLCYRKLQSARAVGESGGSISALDSTGQVFSQRIPQFSTATREFEQTECEERTTALSAGYIILAATRVRSGWVAIARSANARDWILGINDAGEETFRIDAAALRSRSIHPSRAYLTSYGDTVVASSLEWPFNWVLVGPDGDVSTPRSVTLTDDRSLAESVDERWVGLRTVMLDSGFVQVLAERGTERRALVLFDCTGVARRVSHVEGFIGPLDANPENRRLLMLRRTDELELVVYEWEWEAGFFSPGGCNDQ